MSIARSMKLASITCIETFILSTDYRFKIMVTLHSFVIQSILLLTVEAWKNRSIKVDKFELGQAKSVPWKYFMEKYKFGSKKIFNLLLKTTLKKCLRDK